MLLTPLFMGLSSVLYPRMAKVTAAGAAAAKAAKKAPPLVEVEPHRPLSEVVICGYGRVGRNIAQSLNGLRIPCLVIEMDPDIVSELKGKGENCIYGDASNAHVLSLAGLDKAKALVVTYPDPLVVVTTVKNALRINPKLQIVARVHRRRESEVLEKLGVSELVSPEYEASFEFVRRTLSSVGWSRARIRQAMSKLRYAKELVEFGSGNEG